MKVIKFILDPGVVECVNDQTCPGLEGFAVTNISDAERQVWLLRKENIRLGGGMLILDAKAIASMRSSEVQRLMDQAHEKELRIVVITKGEELQKGVSSKLKEVSGELLTQGQVEGIYQR